MQTLSLIHSFFSLGFFSKNIFIASRLQSHCYVFFYFFFLEGGGGGGHHGYLQDIDNNTSSLNVSQSSENVQFFLGTTRVFESFLLFTQYISHFWVFHAQNGRYILYQNKHFWYFSSKIWYFIGKILNLPTFYSKKSGLWEIGSSVPLKTWTLLFQWWFKGF